MSRVSDTRLRTREAAAHLVAAGRRPHRKARTRTAVNPSSEARSSADQPIAARDRRRDAWAT